jgi:hypothetical protein
MKNMSGSMFFATDNQIFKTFPNQAIYKKNIWRFGVLNLQPLIPQAGTLPTQPC